MYTREAVQEVIADVRSKKLSVKKAFDRLKHLPYENLGFARLDHHRHFRKGFPEAVYAPGKTLRQLAGIIESVRRAGQLLLVTRLEQQPWVSLKEKFPDLQYLPEARIAYFKASRPVRKTKPVAVLSAGTADIPVAEEARVTLELIGRRAVPFYDCGVAGFHRLVDQLPALRKCRSVICIAGMDGALPSVVGGILDKPIIAVPTSVGYGANYGGIAPLLTMLNACSQGIAVVNIDNGFGAACFAAMIDRP